MKSPGRSISIRPIWLPFALRRPSTRPPSVTREPERDEHLKSRDFLDVSRYPTITFSSTDIESKGNDSYEILGDLTIRGVTFPTMLKVESVSPEIEAPTGLLRRGASAQAHIDRRHFGLTWNAALESGGFLVGDVVEITIDVELVRDVVVISKPE